MLVFGVLEMVGRAGFQFFELTLRVEPATILSRYNSITGVLLEMVGRAGFEPATN